MFWLSVVLWYVLTVLSKWDFLENSNHLLIQVWEFCLLNSYILCLLFSVNNQFVITLISKNLICMCNLEKLRHFLPCCTQYFLRKKLSIHWFFFIRKLSMWCESSSEFKARFAFFLPKKMFGPKLCVTFQLKTETGKITFRSNLQIKFIYTILSIIC